MSYVLQNMSFKLLFIAQVRSCILDRSNYLPIITRVRIYFFTYELRVTIYCASYELLFTYKIQVTIYCTSYELLFTYKLWFTIYCMKYKNFFNLQDGATKSNSVVLVAIVTKEDILSSSKIIIKSSKNPKLIINHKKCFYLQYICWTTGKTGL